MGDTREECGASMAEAIEFHIEELRLHGYPVPAPTIYVSMLEVAA